MSGKIGIIGATGIMGRPVTRQLINAGFDVKVLSRSISKARSFFPEASVAEADAHDLASLTAALQGTDFLYLNLNVDQTVGPGSWQSEREGLTSELFKLI